MIVGLCVVIITIILIAVLVNKPKKKNTNSEEGLNFQNINEGGYIIVKLSKKEFDETIPLFYNANITFKEERYTLNYEQNESDGSSGLRNLNEDVYLIENISDIFNDSNINNSLVFNITFKKVLNTMENLFQNNLNLLNIDLSSLESKEINSLHSTFLNCINLKRINFTNFNSTKVTTMESTFENCSSLESLDLSSFKTNNLNSMTKAFKNCKNLTNLNLSDFTINENVNLFETFNYIKESAIIIINNNNSFNIISNKTSNKLIDMSKDCKDNFDNCLNCSNLHRYMCEIFKKNEITYSSIITQQNQTTKISISNVTTEIPIPEYPIPSTINPIPSTINPIPTTINPIPTTINPIPSTIDLIPTTKNPIPSTINPIPSTINPIPSNINPIPFTINPVPSTINPMPSTINLRIITSTNEISPKINITNNENFGEPASTPINSFNSSMNHSEFP